MKLSEQLKQDYECGDFGEGLEGYWEQAKELEDRIIDLSIKLNRAIDMLSVEQRAAWLIECSKVH